MTSLRHMPPDDAQFHCMSASRFAPRRPCPWLEAAAEGRTARRSCGCAGSGQDAPAPSLSSSGATRRVKTQQEDTARLSLFASYSCCASETRHQACVARSGMRLDQGMSRRSNRISPGAVPSRRAVMVSCDKSVYSMYSRVCVACACMSI